MKNEVILSPLYDYVFAEIFGNQRNIDNTIGFLKTVIDIPQDDYDRLTVVSPILRRLFHRHKMGIVDLKLTTKSKKIIHIELQVDKTKNLRDRVLYYICRLIGDQLNWGDDYDKLHQVISIVICDHNMLEEESYYFNEYELKNKNNNCFTRKLKLVILELPKIPETEDSAVWRWLKFLKSNKKEDFEMLGKRYPEMEKPIYCAKRMSFLEKWRDIRFHKNLWKVDERMRKLQIEEDLLQAKEDARKERDTEIALKMEEMGLTKEQIKQATGLSAETIANL